VLRDDAPFPVEINPRYTASVEVLEYATRLPALALHRDAFLGAPKLKGHTANDFVGKAIYFAPHTLTVPEDGPWMETFRHPPAIDSMPEFADIPAAGEVIKQGRPVLTCFARAADERLCRETLRGIARSLDTLFGLR
jgi:uncharacterized protein